ncbi:MAG: amidase, partial [Planctomycetales bacterium]
TRRNALRTLAGLGVGTLVFQRALAVQAAETGAVTAEMVRQAEWVAGIELQEEDREAVADGLRRTMESVRNLRQVPIGYDVPPAIHFHAAPNQPPNSGAPRGQIQPIESAAGKRPDSDDDLCFLPVSELAALLRSRQVSSEELTKLYLARLRTHDPTLKCVITYTEELALRQARKADREIAAGRYRGPLHGVPWGAKDLIAVPGYPTTWGAPAFKEQTLDHAATVANRLEASGAVLVAKLSLGALASGDRWFGGKTRNPWNPKQGSSGSSAGSASATAAGLVGFTLGSETLGSIVSPCRRCGATGLRPTFGRVSRHGCMSLAWSMDKIGPITRSVEDCALVFSAIHGWDG